LTQRAQRKAEGTEKGFEDMENGENYSRDAAD
jgi:hypothetical protein